MMTSIIIFTVISLLLYIYLFILFGKVKVDRYLGIILLIIIPGFYGIIFKGGDLIEDLHLERSDDLQFTAFIFIFLYAYLLVIRMKFKN